MILKLGQITVRMTHTCHILAMFTLEYHTHHHQVNRFRVYERLNWIKVGNFRFKGPKPVKNWSDILVADTLPPPCAQVCVEPCTPSSEDCLYLNIFVPSYGLNSSEPLPVAIWYHGGGFSGGSILYDGRHIVEGRDFLMLDPYNIRSTWPVLYGE